MREKTIVLLGWVTIARKQVYQVSSLILMGYRTVIFTNDNFGDSVDWLCTLGEQAVVNKVHSGFFSRFMQIFFFFLKNSECRLSVIAPAGRFSIVYLLICKLFRVKTVCVEWGDIGEISELSWLTQNNMKLCYRYADVVWYKELYMADLLRNYKARNIYFLPNAVQSTQLTFRSYQERTLDFIWVNRLCNRRHPGWFSDAINHLSTTAEIRAVLMGFLDEQKCDKRSLVMQSRIQSSASRCMELLDFGDPYPLFESARFFVLAADVVYGNNALLEAMSCGVVPIVTRSPFVEEVVIDGVNGIVTDATAEGLLSGMKAALDLTSEQWLLMSRNAKKKIEEDFHIDSWAAKMSEMLDGLR